MKNNALNIVFVVLNVIEIAVGAASSGVLFFIGAMMFLFSGLDGAPDYRLSSALMLVFLAATIITAIASLVLNIACMIDRKRNRKTGTELSKGKWITSIALGGSSLVCMAVFVVAFLYVMNWIY